ncbi:hypothetical protein B566_EDAN010656 [Ephemera danica]|nr:hypothetical protein B566_EDAN010656 [Ephemera danica]
MKPFNFDGLMAPAFTPFSDDGKFQLNLSVIPGYLKYLTSSGIKGVLVNGTSGEGASQNVTEREAVAEAWIAARDKADEQCCVVVQVGGAPLPDVIKLAAHAERLGVDGIMCLPDLFYRPSDVDTLANYLSLVSAAAPKTPLLYYHLPSFTGVNLSMSNLMDRCLGGRVPTFVGLKFTSPDLQELGRCMEICRREPLRVFLGCDELMLPAFALGSPSSIATTFNLIPKISVTLEKHIKSGGKLDEAIEIQRKISAAVSCITRGGGWVPTMKAAMAVLTDIPVGPPRPPQASVSEQHLRDMTSDLKRVLSL